MQQMSRKSTIFVILCVRKVKLYIQIATREDSVIIIIIFCNFYQLNQIQRIQSHSCAVNLLILFSHSSAVQYLCISFLDYVFYDTKLLLWLYYDLLKFLQCIFNHIVYDATASKGIYSAHYLITFESKYSLCCHQQHN